MFFDETFAFRSEVYELCFGHLGDLLEETNHLPMTEFEDITQGGSGAPDLQRRIPVPDNGAQDLDEGEVEVDVTEDDDFVRNVPDFPPLPVDQGEDAADDDKLDKISDFSPGKKHLPKVINRKRLKIVLESGAKFQFNPVNPKAMQKDGTPSKSWVLYEQFKHTTDWQSFLDNGGDIGRFAWDLARGFVHFQDPLMQAQFDVAMHSVHSEYAAFLQGCYYGGPVSYPDDDSRSPFYLCGTTKYSILPHAYSDWRALTAEQQEVGIKLVDDPRFSIAADLKELQEIEDPMERQSTYDAIVKEIRQLIELGTFEWDWLPDRAKPLSCKLVLKVKYHADGSYDKHKARLTVRGCFQVPGRDFEETFAPTAGQTTSRILDAIAVLRGWKLKQGDIANAFCQSMVDIPIYIELPKGINVFDPLAEENDHKRARKRRALRLVRALYGLRQSPRLFYKDLASCLQKAGFQRSKYEPCLFWKKDEQGKKLYVLCYVDDLKCTGDSADSLNILEKALFDRYMLPPLTDLSSFTGVAYTRHSAGHLSMHMQPKLASCLLS